WKAWPTSNPSCARTRRSKSGSASAPASGAPRRSWTRSPTTKRRRAERDRENTPVSPTEVIGGVPGASILDKLGSMPTVSADPLKDLELLIRSRYTVIQMDTVEEER